MKQSGFGVAALVLGIVGILLSCLGIGALFGIVALIFGIIAIFSKNKKKGLAIVGLVLGVVSIVSAILFIAINSENDSSDNVSFRPLVNSESGSSDYQESIEYVDESDISKLYTEGDSYKGKYVVLSGQIFTDPEISGDYVYFQMYHNVESQTGNTYVKMKNTGEQYSCDDFVVVDGAILGLESGENAFGGNVEFLQVEAKSVKISDYIECCSPTIKEYSYESQDGSAETAIELYGYKVKIDKVELAENETRFYFTVENNGSSDFYFNDYSTKVLQNGTQYEVEYNYYADYQEIQDPLIPGASSSGIVTFPPLDLDTDFTIYCDCYSDNWEEDIEEIKFVIDADGDGNT